jgi:hypothetical protein
MKTSVGALDPAKNNTGSFLYKILANTSLYFCTMETLHQKLSTAHQNDRVAYTEAKGEFIKKVTGQAEVLWEGVRNRINKRAPFKRY